MRIIKIFLLLFPVVVFGQIEPIQFQPSNIENGIFKATLKVYDEWTGDTVWYYTHAEIPNYVDSIYLSDSILCWRIQDEIFCDTIRLDFEEGTDTSGYNLDFRISNDTLFIRDGLSELFVELPEGAVDTDDQQLSIDSIGRVFEISLEDGGSVKFEDLNTDEQTLSIDSTATSVGITISNGNRVHFDVGEPDTDDQKIDTFEIYDTNKIRISLEDDGEAFKTVTLPTYEDTQDLSIDSTGRVFEISLTDGGSVKFQDIDTDDQTLSIDSTDTTIGISISDGNRVHFDVDQSITNEIQVIDTFQIYDTNKLRISLSDDNEAFHTVDLPEQDSSKWKWNGTAIVNKNTNNLVKVEGTFQVTDLQTGSARTLIAEIGDGTFQQVTIGKGINLNSTTNTISSTERDSTVINEGWGIDVVESPTNTYTVSVDSSIIASNWDLTQISSGMDSLFNGNRAISRVPSIGTNIGSTTFRGWLEWWYIGAYTPPTVSMSSISPTLVEIGTSNNYTLSGSITNTCNFTITSSTVDGTSFTPPSYSKSVNWQPTTKTTKTYTASVGWDETGTTCADGSPNTGTATASRSASSVHPVLYGMSATEYTSGSVPYTGWTKLVVNEGSQSGLTMTGTNMYIYIFIPKTWTDYTVNTIIDHNGFNVTASFTAYDVSITSTGLTNNWTQDYKCYKLNNLTTASGYNYIYNR